ncbi:hypothetical protein [uncultured Aquimarina sp.]|uniref:hypothetical protein n=1 Tax=uncultured Aquimarina sp. TaxID=575652 RepID=UPI0026346D82|nr:hypothetical protein [uncultured Aquimarina sp.]
MKKSFNITGLERIEIDLTLFKFFNEHYTPIDGVNQGYHLLYFVYVTFDEIECNGINWFLSSPINKIDFYNAINFFSDEYKNEIYEILQKKALLKNDQISQEEHLENLIDLMDKVQDVAVSWTKENISILEPIAEELNKIYLEFTVPIIKKRSK